MINLANNTKTKEQTDVFYTSIERRKLEVIMNLIFFTFIGTTNIAGAFIAVSKFGYIGFYFLLIGFLAFFIGFFQLHLMLKLNKGTEQAVWAFAESSKEYTTNYQAGISEKILSLPFLETIVLIPTSPDTCVVKVISSLKNGITKKYNFEIYLGLDQVELFCECLTKHGIEQNQIQNYIQVDQSPPVYL